MRFFGVFIHVLLGILTVAQVQMTAANLAVLDRHTDDQRSLLLQINEEFEYADLVPLEGRIGTQVGDIITLRLPTSRIVDLCKLHGIKYIQLAHPVSPNLKRAIPDIGADRVYASSELIKGYTGKDVIIGVTDWGFDYTHPMFMDTAMEHTRILAAWDQYKQSGPSPQGFDYGTEYNGEVELLTAQKDTVNIYGYATHGTHVAGIAAGGGAKTGHRGVAFESDILMATFLIDEAAVIDAFVWMKNKADALDKRLVINMSWGLYNLGPLDGTSLVSQAIDQLSKDGVVFVTSGGNNGDVNFHIKKSFNRDTMESLVEFYEYGNNPNMWGQSIGIWGQEGYQFEVGFSVYDNAKIKLKESPIFSTLGSYYKDSFLVIQSDTVFYNVAVDEIHPLNGQPTIRLRIKNTHTKFKIGLKAFAVDGTVHFYNVTELTTNVGNWGMPFSAYLPGWTDGDNRYGLGEPASTKSVITVAAYQSEVRISNGNVGGGFWATFSSLGPTIDERMKPDIAAPGVNVASSVSSFTDRSYSLLLKAEHQGKSYPFSRFSGTSMSSPMVAGVVALMLEANPTLSYSAIKQIITATARVDKFTGDISDAGNTQWGFGKINAFEAVKMAENSRKSICCETIFYPNPTSQYLSCSDEETQSISLFSMEGRLLGHHIIGGGQSIFVGDLVSGIYFIRTEKGSAYSFEVRR